MRTHKLILLLATTTLLMPSASATGWLVNVEEHLITGQNVKFGVNVFGGSGDTVDVGTANAQCNDEHDVVDVGVFNREGTGPASCPQGTCQADQGSDFTGLTPLIATLLGNNPFAPGTNECTDDGDTVDVGALNHEGTMVLPPQECNAGPTFPYCSGDEEDAVDVGVLNTEDNDDDDAHDFGVVNCENDDTNDGLDVGLLNTESFDDGSDTFDASIINAETNDPADFNGLNLLPGLIQLQCGGFVVHPPDPCRDLIECPRPVVICTTTEPPICIAVPP